MGQKGGVPHRHIGHDPDEKPRRGGHRCRPAQNEEGPVEDGADNDLTHLRLAVGGQFQREGGGHPLQHRGRQKAGGDEGKADPQQDHPGQQQGGADRGPQPARRAHKKHDEDGDKGGEAAVTGDKAVGKHGQQPLPGGVDDAAAHHPGGVAAKAHGGGESLLPAGAAGAEGFIQIVGDTGEIAHVLQ